MTSTAAKPIRMMPATAPLAYPAFTPRIGIEMIRANQKTRLRTTAGLGSATREAAEVPGVDDGGIARVLAAPLAASVPADGRPYRVRLGAFTSAAEVARVAFPEKAEGVIVRSRQVHRGSEPLLAGPTTYTEDAHINMQRDLLLMHVKDGKQGNIVQVVRAEMMPR